MAARDDLTEEQKMLEKPVKGYQMQKLTEEVADMKVEFLKRFDALTVGLEGIATISYVEKVKLEIEKDFDEKLTQEIQKIHLKYNPTYKGIWWVVSTLVVALVGVLVGALNNFWRGQ